MKSQIPLCRAKKIDSEEYVVGSGFYSGVLTEDPLCVGDCRISNIIIENGTMWNIDSSTLSIHFPDMLAQDSDRLLPNGEKDLRVFASLSEDVKGGDIVHKNGVGFYKDIDEKGIVIHKNGNCYIKYKEDKELLSMQVFHSSNGVISSLKIIGIKQ